MKILNIFFRFFVFFTKRKNSISKKNNYGDLIIFLRMKFFKIYFGSNDKIFLFLFIICGTLGFITAFKTVEFDAYQPVDSYKCGQFVNEIARYDPAMKIFQEFTNKFIRLISLSFPHQR